MQREDYASCTAAAATAAAKTRPCSDCTIIVWHSLCVRALVKLFGCFHFRSVLVRVRMRGCVDGSGSGSVSYCSTHGRRRHGYCRWYILDLEPMSSMHAIRGIHSCNICARARVQRWWAADAAHRGHVRSRKMMMTAHMHLTVRAIVWELLLL